MIRTGVRWGRLATAVGNGTRTLAQREQLDARYFPFKEVDAAVRDVRRISIVGRQGGVLLVSGCGALHVRTGCKCERSAWNIKVRVRRWQMMVDDKAVELKVRRKRDGCSCCAYQESTMNAEFPQNRLQI